MVVNVLPAVDTKIYHFGALLQQFKMAIVTLNPQPHIAKTLFDLGPLSTAHGISNHSCDAFLPPPPSINFPDQGLDRWELGKIYHII